MLKINFEPEKKPPDLNTWFYKLNREYFNQELNRPVLRWNSRLHSSAGRFVAEGVKSKRSWMIEWLWPGSVSMKSQSEPTIEIASYLLNKGDWADLIWDTLAHEMIHFWLWARRRPFGHTPEFRQKMKSMGVSRYNFNPKHSKLKFEYQCPSCLVRFPSRKKLVSRACAQCCRQYSKGSYHEKFKLQLIDSPGLRGNQSVKRAGNVIQKKL